MQSILELQHLQNYFSNGFFINMMLEMVDGLVFNS